MYDLKGNPIALLERAVRRYPDDYRFRMLLGTEFVARNLEAQALRQLEAPHALQPENASVIEKLASLLGGLGDSPAEVRLQTQWCVDGHDRPANVCSA